jgi:hypothetical protein
MRKLHPHQEIVGLSGLTVEDFWIWGYSDMLTNVVRNTFAEFLVGFALGRLHTPKSGQDSIGFDYRDRQVMVKAAAFVQSDPGQKKKSKINFDVRKRRGKRGSNSGSLRTSDCYVFCLYAYEKFQDKDAARNALIDVANWTFYVVSTQLLNELVPTKKTVGISWMEDNCPDGAVRYSHLKRRIDSVLGFPPDY